MDTSKLNLLVYDSKENFEKTKSQLGFEGSTLKRIIHIENINHLTSCIETQLVDDDLMFLVVHVFALDNIKGISEFMVSGIKDKYPNLEFMFISEGASDKDIQKQMVDRGIDVKPIFRYHQVLSELKNDRFNVVRKAELFDNPILSQPLEQKSSSVVSSFPKIKYAIITALYKDEFEELQKVFDFPEEKQIKTDKKIFYRGYLKIDHDIEVVAAVPNSTGMLDSSIIATMLLELFKPEYLLMSGVCGATDEFSYGDIIVAKQVFTFQKGKISDIKREEAGKYVNVDIYDSNNEIVDYNHLFDNDGNQISISIEKFEVEHDTIIQLDTVVEDSLNPKLKSIKKKINETIKHEAFFAQEKEIRIVIEPMACSTMVINKEGFFEDTIKSVHRKTAAVEMESYGVARACQFANNGKTKSIIFKSVMDNTVNKIDSSGGIDWKRFAAFTSAQFMKHLFEEKVI